MNGLSRLLNQALAILDALTGLVGNLAAWLILPLTAVTCYEVAARHVFNAPTVWSYELGYMLTGSYFLLGAAYALREDAHIRIDVLYNRFSDRGKAIANLIGFTLIVLPVALLMTPALFDYAYEAYETSERSGNSAWNPVVWPFRFTFFAGFALLAVQVTAQILKSATALIGER